MINKLLSQKSWQQRLTETKKPILLYGMGDAAQRLITLFDQIGVKVSGVFASDDFVRGHSFAGMTVMSLTEAQSQFGDFVAVPAFALHGSACRLLLDFPHEIIMPNLPVAGDEICDKEYISSNTEAFSYVFELLADEQSKQVLKSILGFNITGEINTLFNAPSEKYRFAPHNKVHIDGGAYDGDTALEHISENPSYGNIIAIEPDAKSFAKLVDNTAEHRGVACLNMALSDKPGIGGLDAGRGRGSRLEGTLPIELTTIDSVCNNLLVGSIKLDCEGSDEDALYGGVNTISEQKPQIAAAVYHKASDLFRIPRLIRYYNPKYRIYLRKIDYIPPWDVFCVAQSD